MHIKWLKILVSNVCPTRFLRREMLGEFSTITNWKSPRHNPPDPMFYFACIRELCCVWNCSVLTGVSAVSSQYPRWDTPRSLGNGTPLWYTSSTVIERSITQKFKAVSELHQQANCVRQVIIKYWDLAALADFQLASRACRRKQKCDRIC